MPTKESARVMAWQKKNRKRFYAARARRRKSHGREDRKNKIRPAPTKGYLELQGLRIDSAKNLDHPRLLWLDTAGRIHVEEELSAEELIRRWKKQHRNTQGRGSPRPERSPA